MPPELQARVVDRWAIVGAVFDPRPCPDNATDSVNRDADDDALRLSEAEVEGAIVGDSWRVPAPTTDVHFTITAKGKHAYYKESRY